MQQLRYLKQIICDSAHQLTNLLFIKERKRELLIMCEDFCSHVIFHLGTHYVSDVCNKIVRCKLNKHQNNKNYSDYNDPSYRFTYIHFSNICCDIPYNQRNHKTDD